MDIAGRVALVTGSGATTGRAIAARLSREGATVVIADVDPEGGRGTVEQIEAAGGKAAFVRSDVRKEGDVVRMLEFAEESFGTLEILVNNAGGTPSPHYPDATPEHWGATLDLNLRGPMLATQVAFKAMLKSGGGVVVNIASTAGLGFRPHTSPEYSAAKAGLIRFTATLSPLKETSNVRVNCVVPDWIGTERAYDEIARMTTQERSRLRPLVPPEEVAGAVIRFVQHDYLAGRVMVMRCGEPPRLIEADRDE